MPGSASRARISLPLQSLAGLQPGGRIVGRGDQHRGCHRRAAIAVEQADTAAEVEVTLGKSPGGRPAPRGKRKSGYAITDDAARRARPAAHFDPDRHVMPLRLVGSGYQVR